MALAGARRAEEVDDLAAVDEARAGPGSRIRSRSSEGWKEKSKPARVLIVPSRPMRSAVLMRLFSRMVSSSAEQDVDRLQRADLALLEAAARSGPAPPAPAASSGRPGRGGCDRAWRCPGPARPLMARLSSGQPAGDGVVELQRALRDQIAGAASAPRRRRRALAAGRRRLAVSRRRCVAGDGLPGPDATAISAPSSKIRISSARVCTSTAAAAGGVGHAVEVAADAHHAFARDAPLQPQHRAERRQRQRAQVRPLLGEGFVHHPAGSRRASAGWPPPPSHRRSWSLRSSRLRKPRARKKSSRI